MSYDSFAAEIAGPSRRSKKNKTDKIPPNPAKSDTPIDADSVGGGVVFVGAALIICGCE